MNPTPDIVNQFEEALKGLEKDYEFHRYPGAGHGFWYYNAEMYRPTAAMDAWEKVFAFFENNLK
jgi:carboxymethylenebutenolidase